MHDEVFDTAVGAAIICALADLTDHQRYAVIGRHIRGRTLEQLAEASGVTRQAVSKSEQRGLTRLAHSLKPLRNALTD